MKSPKNIFITGASSGLGKALAIQYAQHDVTLFLLARNLKKLSETASICKDKGAAVEIIIADVCDDNYEKMIVELSHKACFDLVIANAGQNLLEDFRKYDHHSMAMIQRLNTINYEGQLKTVLPLLDGLEKAHGQIVVISSIAAFKGLPQDPAYCASKSAIKTFFEGCRATWRQKGITVSIVYPGFIKTPMSDKVFGPKPFSISAEKAAKRIQTQVRKQKPQIIFPTRLRILFMMQNMLPTKARDQLLTLFK